MTDQEPPMGHHPENIIADFMPEELNEAVARKLGKWTPEEIEIWKLHWDKKTDRCKVMDQDCYAPDYCHSIEAAWEIVEHMSRDGQSCHLIVGLEGAHCLFTDHKTNRREARGDSVCISICIAFLQLP